MCAVFPQKLFVYMPAWIHTCSRVDTHVFPRGHTCIPAWIPTGCSRKAYGLRPESVRVTAGKRTGSSRKAYGFKVQALRGLSPSTSGAKSKHFGQPHVGRLKPLPKVGRASQPSLPIEKTFTALYVEMIEPTESRRAHPSAESRALRYGAKANCANRRPRHYSWAPRSP